MPNKHREISNHTCLKCGRVEATMISLGFTVQVILCIQCYHFEYSKEGFGSQNFTEFEADLVNKKWLIKYLDVVRGMESK